MFTREIVVKNNSFDVCINPAIECLGVLFILSEFPLNKVRSNGEYVNRVRKYFNLYKNHKIFDSFNTLCDSEYFRYNGPVEMFLNIFYNHTIDEKFCENYHIDYFVTQKFLNDLDDFIKVSNFNEFFTQNRKYYIDQAHIFINKIRDYSPVEYLLSFFRLKSSKLRCALMFGVTTSNYGIIVGKKPYCCVRPYKVGDGNNIDFAYDLPYVTTLLLHEYAHTFINPMTNKYRIELSTIGVEKFKECFDNNPYGEDILTAINEHIIRAIECMYVRDNFKSNYQDFLNKYKDEGFIYLEDLISLYDMYLKNHKIYPNFYDFYPKIIEFFKNI